MSCFHYRRNIDTSLWVVTDLRSNVEIPQGDMEQVRQNTLIKWNRAMITLGPVPDNNRLKITKGLVGCFTHRDNTHENFSKNRGILATQRWNGFAK